MKISYPIHLRRHANLNLLRGLFVEVTEFAAAVGTPRPHLSAMLSGDKECGNELAAKIEAKLERPPGWLDEDHGGDVGSASRPHGLDESAWHSMTVRAQALVIDICRRAADQEVSDAGIKTLHDMLEQLSAKRLAAYRELADELLELAEEQQGEEFKQMIRTLLDRSIERLGENSRKAAPTTASATRKRSHL